VSKSPGHLSGLLFDKLGAEGIGFTSKLRVIIESQPFAEGIVNGKDPVTLKFCPKKVNISPAQISSCMEELEIGRKDSVKVINESQPATV
jgi:hypothetical protein